ncbi:MAG: hypothetical protein ACFHXK_17010 [bacterium]
MRLHQLVRSFCLLGSVLCCSLPGVALGGENTLWYALSTAERQQILGELDVAQSRLLGGSASRSDMRIRAAQPSESAGALLQQQAYQIDQNGQSAGLRLIWQPATNPFSVTEQGLSLTRRF